MLDSLDLLDLLDSIATGWISRSKGRDGSDGYRQGAGRYMYKDRLRMLLLLINLRLVSYSKAWVYVGR